MTDDAVAAVVERLRKIQAEPDVVHSLISHTDAQVFLDHLEGLTKERDEAVNARLAASASWDALYERARAAGVELKDVTLHQSALEHAYEALEADLRHVVRALRLAHSCATIRPGGQCDGCYVSAALARPTVAGLGEGT